MVSILFHLLDFYDPMDGAHCKPTVVMVASIVLGRATGAHDGVPHCYTAWLLQQIRDSAAPSEPESVFTRSMELFGCEGPRTCHPFAKKIDIVQAMFVKRDKKPFCTGNNKTCTCVCHAFTRSHSHMSFKITDGSLFSIHCFTLPGPSGHGIVHNASLWDHHNHSLPDNLRQG